MYTIPPQSHYRFPRPVSNNQLVDQRFPSIQAITVFLSHAEIGGEGGDRTHLPLEATDLQSAVLPLEHLLHLKDNYTRLGKVWQI